MNFWDRHFDVRGVEGVKYCTKDQRHVKGVKACGTDFNALIVMYVEGVKSVFATFMQHCLQSTEI